MAPTRKSIKVNSMKVTPKKKTKHPTVKNENEIMEFLTPDASPKKNKRKKSPPRVPCPLADNVPVVPPKRKLQPWQMKTIKTEIYTPHLPENTQILESEAGPSQSQVGSTACRDRKVSFTELRPESHEITFSSSETPQVNALPSLADILLTDVDMELVGFTPTPTDELNYKILSLLPGPSLECASADEHDYKILSPLPDPSQECEPHITFADIHDVILGSDIDDDDENCNIPGEDPLSVASSDIPSHIENIIRRNESADDSVLIKLASGESELYSFNWSSDPNTFVGEREIFTGQAGPTFDTKGKSPLQIFQEVWDEGIMDLIVRETNRYAHQMISTKPHQMEGWADITNNDIWIYFAVLMLQSIIHVPVEREYWYPCLPELKMGNFSVIMSYKKFLKIKKCLHFVDNVTTKFDDSKDNNKVRKLLPIINHLNNKFSSLYLPEQNIVIDESLLLWKGRLSFAQLIATKAARVGIKTYELCESRTGYLWRMLLYTGKGDVHGETAPNQPEKTTAQIVYKLARPLFNKGHTLVMDNFYNAPLLSRLLKQQKTDSMGTLRLNRAFVPDSLRSKTKLNMRQGEIAARQTNDLTIVVWRDLNLVGMISSYHKVLVGGKEKHGLYKYKPQVVLDYNLHMGGVDKKDQMLQAFPLERIRNQVWYKKVFRRLLNISIHNTFIIFNNDKTITQRTFRVALVQEILKTFQPPKPQLSLPSTGHFPTKNSTGRSRCTWCNRRKVETRTAYKCDTCNANLCIVGCFREFHVFQNNKIP